MPLMQFPSSCAVAEQPPHSQAVSLPASGEEDACFAATAVPEVHEWQSPAPTISLAAVRRSLFELNEMRESNIARHRSAFYDVERIHRSKVAVVEVKEVEQLARTFIGVSEAIAIDEIERVRRQESLAPWCNNSCKYCCMSRYHWDDHVITVFNAAQQNLFGEESRNRQLIADTCELITPALKDQAQCGIWMLSLRSMQRETFGTQEAACREAVLLHEGQSLLALTARHAEVLAILKQEEATLALRNKHLTQFQQLEKLQAIEQRVWRQLFYSLTESEKETRASTATLEQARRRDLHARLLAEKSALDVSMWHEQVKDVFAECERLRHERKLADAEAVEKERAAAAAAQAALEEELREMKKLKKAGPPKTTMFQPCTRCQQIPAKDFYVHRLEECPERPTQCIKCLSVFPMSNLENHRGTCPARVVQCQTCQNHYKAGYFDSVHQASCGAIADAGIALAGARPRLPIRVVLPSPTSPSSVDTLSPQGLQITFEVAVQGIPPGTCVGLQSVNSTPIYCHEDILAVARDLSVGQQVQAVVSLPRQLQLLIFGSNAFGATVMSTEPRVSPRLSIVSPHGAGNLSLPNKSPRRSLTPRSAFDEPQNVTMPVQVVVRTTLPDDVYESCKLLVASDQAQYCKPQLEGKKRPATAPAKK